MKAEFGALKETDKKLKESRQKMYALHRNNAKKLKRRDEKISSHSSEVMEKELYLIYSHARS